MPENKKSFLDNFRKSTRNYLTWNDGETNTALKISGLILLSLLSIFVLVKTISEIKAYNTIGEIPSSPYSITVSGKGEVMGVKDIATLTFTSYGKAKTASDAQAQAAKANNKAIAFLKSKGVADKDMNTDYYNTYPIYDQKVRPCPVEGEATPMFDTDISVSNSAVGTKAMPSPSIAPVPPCSNYESVITGYETNQMVTIKIRDINNKPELSSQIITGLGEAGVQVGNLQNSIDNIDNLKAEARRIAISKAHDEAVEIARALGARLGKVVTFSEDGMGGYAMYEKAVSMDARAVAAPSPEIPVGEGKVTSNVSVTYEIR